MKIPCVFSVLLFVLLAFVCPGCASAADAPVDVKAGEAREYPGWVTPRKFDRLSAHPRLFISPEQINRMVKGRGADFAAVYDAVAAAAEAGVADVDAPLKGEGALGRSFKMVGRLLSLSIQWHRTGDRRYLDAALKNIDAMEKWMPPTTNIQLWEGQQIAAVAMTYDLLYNDLTPEQRARMVAFARTHCIEPFLRVTGSRENPMVEGEHGSWWQRIISNWNPVCVSGPGLLALAMYEDLPEAQTVVDRVDNSFAPILDYLQQTRGGWVEGLGYWNWTIHYMSLYMISYERSTGQKHPGLRSEGYRETLRFGLHFVPFDEACGFGDNQHGNLSASLFQTAEFIGDRQLLKELQDYQLRHASYTASKKKRIEAASKEQKPTESAKAGSANIDYGGPLRLLIEPDPVTDVASAPVKQGYAMTYPEQGWGMVADRWPEPNVYASFRGGIASGAHTHADLLSWNGVVGIERMILDYNKAGYYSPSFYGRAKEIFERSPQAKNTIFIAGVSAYVNDPNGRRGPPRSRETVFQLPTGPAVRLDAARAFYLASENPKVVSRVFAVVGDKGLLVLDRIEQPGQNPIEVRTHTDKAAEFGKTDVLLTGRFETARMTFAADAPAVLRRADAMITDARATPPTVIRWQTLGNVGNVTLASFLSRGSDPVTLTVECKDSVVTVTAEGKGWRNQVKLNNRLEPIADTNTGAGPSR